jgi:hypothetical protein
MIFQFDSQVFFYNLIIIKNQLILISYENVELKEEGSKWKKTSNLSGMS